jgi:hypothetical protein
MSPSAQSETIPTPGDSIDEQTPTDEPTPEESTSQEITGKFGQTVTWNDGIAVMISKPRAYHPSEYAAGGTKNNVVFTVTLKNGTGKRLDPSGFSTKLADSVGEADEIFDTGNLPEAPQTSMRAGKSVTWKIAYGLHQKGMTGLTMEVNPVMDFDHTTAIFEN